MVSSVYLWLLIFLPAILIPACASSSLAFHMMFSAYKLNKHGDNIQSWHTPFPIWNQSIVPCPVLTVASWHAYRFLRRQVKTVVLEKTLESPWTPRRSNQSILKEISPEHSLEGVMLKLKLQYFGHLMQRINSWKRPWCWERLKAGGEGDDRRWDGWMASPTQWAWV